MRLADVISWLKLLTRRTVMSLRLLTTTATILLVAATRAAAADDAKATLKYGDGTPEGKQSLGGSGEMIEFELPSKAVKISGLRIHGARYGAAQAPQDSFL